MKHTYGQRGGRHSPCRQRRKTGHTGGALAHTSAHASGQGDTSLRVHDTRHAGAQTYHVRHRARGVVRLQCLGLVILKRAARDVGIQRVKRRHCARVRGAGAGVPLPVSKDTAKCRRRGGSASRAHTTHTSAGTRLLHVDMHGAAAVGSGAPACSAAGTAHQPSTPPRTLTPHSSPPAGTPPPRHPLAPAYFVTPCHPSQPQTT